MLIPVKSFGIDASFLLEILSSAMEGSSMRANSVEEVVDIPAIMRVCFRNERLCNWASHIAVYRFRPFPLASGRSFGKFFLGRVGPQTRFLTSLLGIEHWQCRLTLVKVSDLSSRNCVSRSISRLDRKSRPALASGSKLLPPLQQAATPCRDGGRLRISRAARVWRRTSRTPGEDYKKYVIAAH